MGNFYFYSKPNDPVLDPIFSRHHRFSLLFRRGNHVIFQRPIFDRNNPGSQGCHKTIKWQSFHNLCRVLDICRSRAAGGQSLQGSEYWTGEMEKKILLFSIISGIKTYLKIHNGGFSIFWCGITQIHRGIAGSVTKDKCVFVLIIHLLDLEYPHSHSVNGLNGNFQFEIIKLGELFFVQRLKFQSGTAWGNFWQIKWSLNFVPLTQNLKIEKKTIIN